MNEPDAQLLKQYLEEHSEAAFTELVRRHFDLVHSVAMRQLAGDPHLARDVAQTVFADLARKARGLTGRASLAGWLYTSACFAAAKAARSEQRRRVREQEVVSMQATENESGPDWEQLAPLIDQAMQQLDEQEREAVVLRYFEKHEYRVVGTVFGVSEEAARKRVDRALQKLRDILQQHGLNSSCAGLAAALSTQAVVSAPISLAAGVSAGVLATTGVSSSFFLLPFTLMNKAAIPLAALVLAGAVAPILLQQKTIRELRSEIAGLQERVAQVEAGAAAEPTPSAEAVELERLRQERSELLRLRGEVARLRQQLAEAAAKRPPISPKPALRQPAEVDSEPVQTFMANADATVGPGQALVFGGWPTPAGKYTFVFVQPKIAEDMGSPSVEMQGTFAEVPDEIVTSLGLEALKSGSRATAGQSLLSSDQVQTLLRALKSSEGVTILSSPRMISRSGWPAAMQVTEQKTIAGTPYTLGPTLDIEPRIAADGSSVNLTISAKLKKATEGK